MIHRDGWLQIKTRIDNKGFNAQIKQLENRIDDLKSSLEMASQDKTLFSKTEIINMEAEVEKLTSKLDVLKKKQLEIDSDGLFNIKEGIKNINSSISKTIKKVGKLALAVFGVRTAYLAVRTAASLLAQYNEQIGADLEYIKFALATVLQPIVEKLISLVYTLLGYINMISKALFNYDLFANAGVNAFKKANKGAKELKKTLLGFDEINQLQDNNSDSSSGGVAPSIDLSNMEEPDLKGLYSWTDKVKKVVGTTFDGIRKNIISVMTDFGFSEDFIDGWSTMTEGVGLLFNGMLDTTSGVIQTITGLVTGDTEQVKEGIKKIAIGIGEILLGLMKTVIGIFSMIIATIRDTGLGFWNKIKTFVKEKVIGWFDEQIDTLNETIAGRLFGIMFEEAKVTILQILNVFNGLFKGVGQILDGILYIFKGDFKKGLISIGKGIVNALISILNTLIWSLNTLLMPFRAIIVAFGKVTGKNWNMGNISLPHIPYLASGGIVDIPKTGLNIGNAIVGEAGAEGVLPLTNADTMSKLGKEIAKWITIDLNITNEIDGRVLNKRLETIKGENNFARNGG